MTLQDRGWCQARVEVIRADGTDACSRRARHEHLEFTSNTRLRLCTQHLHSLKRRENLGSSEHLLDLWLQGHLL